MYDGQYLLSTLCAVDGELLGPVGVIAGARGLFNHHVDEKSQIKTTFFT
jgi:hypothetical protein